MKWTKKAAELQKALNGAEDDSLEEWLSEQLDRAIGATSGPDDLPDGCSVTYPARILDHPVTRWLTQAELAELADVSTRSLQRWERKGLPAFGDGPSKRYPLPHALAWVHDYQWRTEAERRSVAFLPLEIAIASTGLRSAAATSDRKLRVS